MEEPITIVDRETLKVLSADTRMDILKKLGEGNRTPSDLGKYLHKSDATIVEHLEVMSKAGLVKKIEQPGRKWIFYTLTEKGKGIISSRSRRLVIILSSSILTLGISGFSIFKYFSQQNFVATMEKTAPLLQDTVTSSRSVETNLTYLYLGIAFFLVGASLLSFYLYKKSKDKGAKKYEG
jgi:DNA-binding transcriptional ArsR family regulator